MKKRSWLHKARLSLALTLSMLGAGCLTARVNDTMQSWVGIHYSQLLMQWGPPQSVYDDGQGGRILVYTARRQWTTPGQMTTATTASATIYDNMIWGQAQSSTQFTLPETQGYVAWRMFRINSKGIVYNWSWRGL